MRLNLRDSGDGLPPVPHLGRLAGFSHPGISRFLGLASALIAPRKAHFLFFNQNSPIERRQKECVERMGEGSVQDLSGLTEGSDGRESERRGTPSKPDLVLAASEALERNPSLLPTSKC